MKKLNLLVLFALVGVSSLIAQTKDYPWAIGVYGTKVEYLGNLRVYDRPDDRKDFVENTIFNFNDGMRHFGAAVSFDRYLNRFLDLGAYGSWGSIGYDHVDKESASRRNFQSVPLWNGNLHLRVKFLGKDEARWVPYVTLGFGGLWYNQIESAIYNPYDAENASGVAKYTDSDGENKGFAAIATGGLGLEYKITPRFSARYQADLGWTNQDQFDDGIKRGVHDCQLQHSLGLVFAFGGGKDSDKDGVKDKKDKCAKTPLGVKVDANGCPVDTDADGVADYQDECPDMAGTVKGCPDADGDGVADKDDQCPNTPKGIKVDAKGCPVDSDGDGVADDVDKCPNTPKTAKVDATGCPIDTDGDGVADYLDKCPDTPKNVKVDTAGCPVDTDGDGIADYLDKCPNVKGVPANNGCPEVKAEAKKAFQRALHGIQFATGKSTIKPASYSTLDAVVKVLKDNPDYKIDINGHTDNVGKTEANMKLSQERADAVKQYLVKKGVDSGRIITAGFGDTKPVADNTTEKGRAENRRVEFTVNFER